MPNNLKEGSEPLNQCQGCQAGWELRRYTFKGFEGGSLDHLVPGGYPGETVGWTRSLYIMEDDTEGGWPEFPEHEERVTGFFKNKPIINWNKYRSGEWNSEE